jgi:hypothetical protein
MQQDAICTCVTDVDKIRYDGPAPNVAELFAF